jgi:phospholipase/carboxylesterase
MRITRRRFLASASAVVMPPLIAGQRDQTLEPGLHPLGLDHDRDGLVYVPHGYRADVTTPLLVLFHGAGSTAHSAAYAFPLADEHGVIILAPDSRDQRSWDLVLGAYGPDADFLADAMRSILNRLNVDRQQFAVAGHSDGASYALSFGIGAGDVFRRIVAFSPGVMTPTDARGTPKIFISHGTDDDVMPIDDTSRRFVPRLRTLGYEVTYREYAGGHAVPPEIVGAAFDWAYGK